jgi:CheY-like chemotaxis protein
LKDSNHSVETVNSLLNKSRLNLSQVKNESLAVLYLEKNELESLTVYQISFQENLNYLLKIVDSENTHSELFESVELLKKQNDSLKVLIDEFKQSIVLLRISESYLFQFAANDLSQGRHFDLQVSKSIDDLINFVVRSKIEELDKVHIYKQRIQLALNGIEYDSYKKIELLIKHIDILIKNRRSSISTMNEILNEPLDSLLSSFHEIYNSHQKILTKGFVNILKASNWLNTFLLSFIVIMLIFTRKNNERDNDLEEGSVKSVHEMAYIFNSFSHRVKNPMNGIIGMMSLIKGTNLDEEQKQYIQGIEQSSNYLSSLLHDLVEYSKLKSGEAKINYKSVDFFYKAEEYLERYKENASKKNLNFSIIASKSLPTNIFVDIDKLLIIIDNLVQNGIKYTDSGFVKVKFDFEKLGEGHGKLLISFKDSGVGIKEDSVEELLSNIELSDSQKNSSFSGLGLSICDELLKLMGGDLHLVKGAEKGTEFLVSLQVQIDSSKAVRSSTISSIKEDLSTYRVLVAEDEKINQKVIGGILKKLNQHVTIVNNGKELVDTFSPGSFDLILVDMIMPELDGLAATRILNQKFPNLLPPVIALSGNEKDKYLSKCLEVGMVDFISKPIKKNEIKNLLIKYCSNKPSANVA